MSDIPLPPRREPPPDWLMKPPPPAPPVPPAASAWPSRRRRALRVALPAAGLLGAYGIGMGYGSWSRVCAAERCPSISRLVSSYKPQQSSKVYAADGRLITEFFFERRTVMPLPDIPMPVRQAFIATEDKRF